ILGIGKGILRFFSSDFPLLGAPPIPVICSIILTSDFPLLEAEVALIVARVNQQAAVHVHDGGFFLWSISQKKWKLTSVSNTQREIGPAYIAEAVE
ncbi:hypothetical protein L208DRAFT_1333942, partial [Tricholoma matsutake]